MSDKDGIKAMTWFEFLVANVTKGHSMEELRAGFHELKASVGIDVAAMDFKTFRAANKGKNLSMTDLSLGFHEMKGTEAPPKKSKAKPKPKAEAAAPPPRAAAAAAAAAAAEAKEEVKETVHDVAKLNRMMHALGAEVKALTKKVETMSGGSAADAMPAAAAKAKKPPSAYNLFTKKYFAEHKDELAGLKLGESASIVAAKWREHKEKAEEKPADEKKHDAE